MDLSDKLKGCFSPFKKKGESTPLPCGKCPYCRNKRINQWIFRLKWHAKYSNSAIFVTLTYDNEHVPITPNRLMTLRRKDARLFFVRLRKYSGQTKDTPEKDRIKYYIVGEYGSKTHRPHYHAIIFNADVMQVEKSWKHGSIHVGSITSDSLAYTLKYINKQKDTKRHNRDDREMEFANISNGIGRQYTDNSKIVKRHKEQLYSKPFLTVDGYRLGIPRYYKDKMFTDEEKEMLAEHMKSIAEAEFDPLKAPMSRKEHEELLQYKKEKYRLMHKRAKGSQF